MDGILIIDKPEGFTSHDVVARLRRILKTKKIGHTGTLDPFATGVLVMLVGKATRLAQFLDKDEKEYEAVVRFGFETDTGDRTGMRSAECGVRNEELLDVLARTDWENLLAKFRGGIAQTPPMYSAKKIDGKKLYEHARKGVEIERKPINVTINKLEIISADEIRDPRSAIRIRVACSAGTYIRTLAEVIGRAVGFGAHLAELRRTRAGRFDISQAVKSETLEIAADPRSFILQMNEAVTHLRKFSLPKERVEKTRNGMSTGTESDEFIDGETLRMTAENGELIAIGYYDKSVSSVKPKVVLV
ncbi:MAG: tRNA pseudouridine(55) synthase TruB [Pyrinomonadaceae bacterium]